MARVYTLAQLRTRVLRRADAVNLTNFVSNAEADDYINEAISDLDDLITEVAGHEWNLKSVSTSLSAGSNEITLKGVSAAGVATDFYMLQGIDAIDGTEYIPLKPFSFRNRHKLTTYSGKDCLRYRLYTTKAATAGSAAITKIRISPTPTEAVSFEIWYTPHAPLLALDADEYDGANGWDQFIVVDAAAKILQKQQLDSSHLLLRRTELINRIKSAAANRDARMPEVIEEVDDADE